MEFRKNGRDIDRLAISHRYLRLVGIIMWWWINILFPVMAENNEISIKQSFFLIDFMWFTEDHETCKPLQQVHFFKDRFIVSYCFIMALLQFVSTKSKEKSCNIEDDTNPSDNVTPSDLQIYGGWISVRCFNTKHHKRWWHWQSYVIKINSKLKTSFTK